MIIFVCKTGRLSQMSRSLLDLTMDPSVRIHSWLGKKPDTMAWLLSLHFQNLMQKDSSDYKR